MKKAVLFFAALFAVTTFLNAQTDCTNENSDDIIKTKKEKVSMTGDLIIKPDSKDCSNPDKSYYYMPDRFQGVLAGKTVMDQVGSIAGFGQFRILAEERGSLCCTPPPHEQNYNVVRNPKRIQ